jgi:uncharacterized SAM-dependent methyltransferase
MILDSVDQFFDETVRQKMLAEIEKKYSSRKIDKIVKNAIINEAQKYTDKKRK